MINTIIKPSLEEAKFAAMSEAGDTMGTSFPVSMFTQGDRTFLSTVLSVFYIVNNIRVKPIKKEKGVALGLNEVNLALNRPLDNDHAKGTKDYLLRNYIGKYILPGLTLNIQGGINVFSIDAKTGVKPGYLVLPMGANFTITDGQHRKAALDLLSNELPQNEFMKIANDGIPVMITTEEEIAQIHQDFSDCSKTKQLPKSLIAVYDTRNPANGLVMHLINKCPLFTGKVDAASSSLSKNSTKLFLVSQIRSLIKELFLGNSATGDNDLEQKAHEQYSEHPDALKTDIEKYVGFINKLTKKIEILNRVANFNAGVDMSSIPGLRGEYLILNSAGINIVGRVGNYLFREKKDVDPYIDLLAKIDWKKSGELWQGNIVQAGAKGEKIATSNSTIKAAYNKVREELGLETKNQKDPVL
jgi:DNA sulfur modification protein DndB